MKNLRILIFVVFAGICVSGCAIKGTNISKKGTVKIERIASERVRIPWADAYQDGNNLTITGVVEQRYQSTDSFKVYVEVAIRDANDQLLKEARTVDVYVPRKSSGKGINWTDFKLTIQMVVPKGVTIKLAVHGA